MASKILDIDLADGPPADLDGLTSYDKAIEINPRYVEAWNNRIADLVPFQPDFSQK